MLRFDSRKTRRCSSAAPQRGVVLFVALIVLVIMTLAGITLLRQMSGTNAVAGNIAFKEATTSAADIGIEDARRWLISYAKAGNSLNDDIAANGYHATWVGGVDPTQYDWPNAFTTTPSTPVPGFTVRYVIHRLCETAGRDPADPAQRCSDVPAPGGASHGGGSYGNVTNQLVPLPFYRITARVDGPRNTTSYTQVLMY